MSTGGFQRVAPLGDGFIRGPARILICPYNSPFPTKLGSVVNLATSGYTTEKQEITKQSAEATTGTFKLAFNSFPTTALKFNATKEEVQAALENLPSVGIGGVKVEGGPLTTTAMTVTFAGENAEHAQPLLAIVANELKKTAEPVSIEVKRLTAGFGLYDPVGVWTELGSTLGGIKINRNNTESLIGIDQIQASLLALPDEWEMTVDTALAETSLENVQIAWEGGVITTDVTQSPNERHLGIGNPSFYEERRMAVLHKKTVGTSAGKIRGHLFRKITKSPQSSTLEYQKTGNQSTLPLTFRCFADPIVADPKYSMGEIVDQNYA